LLATEGVSLRFLPEAVEEIAAIAAEVNRTTEDIGARRLHTVVERLLENLSFDAPDMSGQEVVIDAAYVRQMLGDIVKNEDLSRYIL
jgi:ATP-dependent HslUV protease ATP-binding subunit HslU